MLTRQVLQLGATMSCGSPCRPTPGCQRVQVYAEFPRHLPRAYSFQQVGLRYVIFFNQSLSLYRCLCACGEALGVVIPIAAQIQSNNGTSSARAQSNAAFGAAGHAGEVRGAECDSAYRDRNQRCPGAKFSPNAGWVGCCLRMEEENEEPSETMTCHKALRS